MQEKLRVALGYARSVAEFLALVEPKIEKEVEPEPENLGPETSFESECMQLSPKNSTVAGYGSPKTALPALSIQQPAIEELMEDEEDLSRTRRVINFVYRHDHFFNFAINVFVLGIYSIFLSLGLTRQSVPTEMLISFICVTPILLSMIAVFLPKKSILYTELCFYGAVYIIFIYNGNSLTNALERVYFCFPTILFSGCFIYHVCVKNNLRDQLSQHTNKLRAALYNIFVYIVPFCFGLNFRYYTLVMPDVSLKPSEMKYWDQKTWSFMIGFFVCVGVFVLFSMVLIAKSNKWRRYVVAYFFVILISVLISIPTFKADSPIEIHVHHYVWTTLLLPLTAFPNPFSGMVQAWMLAIHLDGVVRWGMDDTWEYKHKDLW
jgi:hypothetical protein